MRPTHGRKSGLFGADCDASWTSDEHSLMQLMEHVDGALFPDASGLLEHAQRVIASLDNGKNAEEHRALLGAG